MLVGLTLLLLVLDQGSKWLVRQNLAFGEAWAPIPALSRFFTVTHVQNTGVAFGQMAGLGWLFLLVNVGVAVGILVYYSRIPQGQWLLRSGLGPDPRWGSGQYDRSRADDLLGRADHGQYLERVAFSLRHRFRGYQNLACLECG